MKIHMKLFLSYTKDAVKYALSDRKGIIVIGLLMTISSILYKDDMIKPIWKLTTVSLLIVIGYGSYVSWYTLKGSDKHPKFNRLKKLTWEGFKKTMITVTYSFFLGITYIVAKLSYDNGNFIITFLCIILFTLIYLCLIGGLLNRYLHKGQISKAFDIPEIINLIRIFDTGSFIRVLIAVIISQIFAVSVVVGFTDGFSLIELVYSISTFFLAPFLYVATKRLVGLNVRNLLEKRDNA